MKKTLPTLIRFSAAIVAALALILVAPVLAETPDEKRKKKSRAGSFPSSAREATAGSRIMRPAVQPKPPQTRTPPANYKMKEAGDSVRSRPPRPGKTPSSGSDKGYSGNQQARTAGDQSAGKRQISSPSLKQGSTVQGKAATSPSATVAAKRSSPRTYPYDIKTPWGTVTVQNPNQEPRRDANGKPIIEPPEGPGGASWIAENGTVVRRDDWSKSTPARTYPYDIKTPWGTVTVQNPSQEPKRDAKGKPIIEKPEDNKNGISWITDKDMVVRSKLTKEQIADIAEEWGEGVAQRTEDKNRRGGSKEVKDDLNTRAGLELAGVPADKAKKIADKIAESGTGKARDEAIIDAMIDENWIPAGLKNTGRPPKHLIRISEVYQDLGGTDPSKMPPEFVEDVENAKRKGNAAEVMEKWNERISVLENPPTGGSQTAPGLTGGGSPSTRPGLIGTGSKPASGGLPSTGNPFGPGGTTGGANTGGSQPGSTTGSSGKGPKPESSWSERQAGQAEGRLDRINQGGNTSGASTNSGNSAPPTQPSEAPNNSTNKPAGGDITFEIEDKKAVESEPVTEGEQTDAAPAPTPNEAVADVPPPGVDDPQGTYKGWNQGFHPGIAGEMSNLGPKKGGEKINPGEQGTTGTTGGKQSSGAPRGKGQVTDPPKPLDPKSSGGPPTERPRGPKPETVYPAPDAPDQAAPIPGDTGKLTDKLGQEDDGTAPKEPTGSSGGTATATPARLRPGEKIERGGKKQGSPTPTPTYAPGGQYTIGQPNLTPPPSPSPTPPPDN